MTENTATGSTSASIRTKRYRKILKDELLADVTFLVGNGKVPVKANKTILRCSSSVFWDMFDENEKEQNVYEVPDLEADEFRKFLEYLYTGELQADFQASRLMLKGAMLYDEKDLAAHCVKQLIKSTNIDNCGSILSLAIETKNKVLEDASVEFICKPENAAKIFQQDSEVLNFSEAALSKILSRDELDVDELSLFEAIVKWGKQDLANAGANVNNPKYLRSVLENLIPLIRFPLMDPSNFSTKVGPTGLLTVEETMAVLLCFNVKESDRATYKSSIFNSKPRTKTGRQCQYCTFIATIGQAQIEYGHNYGIVPPVGQWYCISCSNYSHN